MKKLFLIILGLVLSAQLVFINKAEAVANSLIASYEGSGDTNYNLLNMGHGQTFYVSTSTYDTLSLVEIYVSVGVVGSFTMKAYPENVAASFVEETTTLTSTGDRWMRFDVDDVKFPVSKAANGSYVISVTSTSSNASWVAKMNSNPYSRGNRVQVTDGGVGLNDYENDDFKFRVYGYKADVGTTPTPTATQVSGTTTDSSNTSGVKNGAAPSATTSADIAKPTNLVAEETIVSDKAGVKLTWTKSTTTSADGYLIFRSQTTGASYKKIGSVTKDKAEFIDADVTTGTYYYMVRAYDGTLQSANSNEATITLAVAGSAAANLNITKIPEIVDDGATGFQFTTFGWFLWSLALALTGFLVFLLLKRHKLEKSNKSIKK